MKAADIKVFAHCLEHYFETIAGSTCTVDDAVQLPKDFVADEYTVMMGMAGYRSGALYISTSEQLLKDVSHIFLQGDNDDPDVCQGMISEMGNTVAGNAKNEFGESFVISLPMVIHGKDNQLTMPLVRSGSVLLPATWQGHAFSCVLAFDYDDRRRD